MKLRVFLTLLFGILMFSQQGVAQTKTKQKTQLVKYGKNVDTPLTAKEMSMLKEVYQDKLNEYILNNKQKVKDFKHLLRNRIEIKQMPNIKDENKFTRLSSVELFDHYNLNLTRDKVFNKSTFNPLKYNLNFFIIGSSIYKIDNTNYFIVIKSQTNRK
ncbi:hypothetical protein JAO71_09150 [Olleya sp. YSTF-M6]|uniref:Uncharacterized protein n=1 Tax=Olleya sediminilitoris TaxID=2795739 RepID=A0ABS1WLG3_9FLAO|nr:hypothetical protein [Olleya sediminilitoris]MBL7559967.1 hypothetical protein [Olleya sediminilitoris]